jgi:putative ABC transport system permease protein
VHGVAEVQGRDRSASSVDRPEVVSGHWIGRDGLVVERAFAQALGLSVGQRVVRGSRPQRVVGIAVSAALPPYPQLCTVGCILERPAWFSAEPGLVWTSRATAESLASAREPIVLFQYLRLRDPASAPHFVRRHGGDSWQSIAARQAEQVRNERAVVVFGSTMLVILALATLGVLVGARMSDEVRRVGMLKAAGAGPGFVTGVLLVSYVGIALVSSIVGLLVGKLLAPRLIGLSAGLLGQVGATVLTPADALVVVGTLVAMVLLASVLPAWRASRTSTVGALAASGRAPRRRGHLVAASSRLPAAGLLGIRLAARRPRRTVLTAVSIAVVACAGVVVLLAQSGLHAERGNAGGPADPQVAQLHTVMTAMTLLLATLAAVNLLFVTRASAADARRPLAVVRALGVTPAEAVVALGLGQLIPATVGLVVGGAAGDLVYRALSPSHSPTLPLADLLGLALLTLVLTSGLAAVPARLEIRRPLVETLRERT